MKDLFKIIMVMAVMLMAAVGLQKCQKRGGPEADTSQLEIIDKTVETDTIKECFHEVAAVAEVGTIQIKVPADAVKSTPGYEVGNLAVKTEQKKKTGNIIEQPGLETDEGDVIELPDSVTLELPIEQRIYEGENFKAWVSGVDPCLDSINVVARRETVVVKKPPNKWHLGPCVGIGVTPRGVEPFVGFSLTYSIISF